VWLLAEGASNPDISKALDISRRTTEHHVEHILAKLTVTSRTVPA
jgi:non-specific serine/threonine protein kinase